MRLGPTGVAPVGQVDNVTIKLIMLLLTAATQPIMNMEAGIIIQSFGNVCIFCFLL